MLLGIDVREGLLYRYTCIREGLLGTWSRVARYMQTSQPTDVADSEIIYGAR